MKHFKIEIYEQDVKQATIRIPRGVLRFAYSLIPQKQRAALEQKNIDIDGLLEVSKLPEVNGVLMDIEDHVDQERVLISMES